MERPAVPPAVVGALDELLPMPVLSEFLRTEGPPESLMVESPAVVSFRELYRTLSTCIPGSSRNAGVGTEPREVAPIDAVSVAYPEA